MRERRERQRKKEKYSKQRKKQVGKIREIRYIYRTYAQLIMKEGRKIRVGEDTAKSGRNKNKKDNIERVY